MESSRRPPSLNIPSSIPARPISTSPSSSHRQSQSPFRYVQFHQGNSGMNEKAAMETPLADVSLDQKRRPPSPLRPGPSNQTYPGTGDASSSRSSSQPRSSRFNPPAGVARIPSLSLRAPTPLLVPYRPTQPYTRPRGLRIYNLLKPWIPLILYGITSFGFLVAIALWKKEVFARLDELSSWLQTDEQFGYGVLFFLIFVTTFPPIPLYSTLIILSGYTFGPWTGAIISYFAALTGALTVFILSRTLIRDTITRWLSSTITIKRVVRAIEKRPKLLFLIRLAPYPYNVMNCLLAASPTLTLRTYTTCTALSLFKVIIHTSLGASIHSFKDYHVVVPEEGSDSPIADEDTGANTVARAWTVIGIVLCVAIFIYLSYVARKAIDEELDDDALPSHTSEEALAFLSTDGQAMTETPFRAHDLVPPRQSEA